jgi:hypothetical protein
VPFFGFVAEIVDFFAALAKQTIIFGLNLKIGQCQLFFLRLLLPVF